MLQEKGQQKTKFNYFELKKTRNSRGDTFVVPDLPGRSATVTPVSSHL